MTEQEQLILDGVLRDEPFICVHDGYSYFLGPEAPTELDWQDAIDWCKSLGDEYELPSKEIINTCFKNKIIRKEFKRVWYWSSDENHRYVSDSAFCVCIWHFLSTSKNSTNSVRSVRKIKI